MVLLGQQVKLGYKEQRDPLVKPELLDILDQLDLPEFEDHRELLVLKVQLVQPANQDQSDQLVFRDHQERPELKVQTALLEPKVQLETLEHKVQSARQVMQVPSVYLVPLAFKDLLVRLVRLDRVLAQLELKAPPAILF